MGLTRSFALGAAAALSVVSTAGAQETGTPVFSAPYRAFAHHDIGLSLSAPEGSDLGVEGFFSFASGRNDFGLRVGALDAGESALDFALGLGLDIRLARHVDLRVSGSVGDLEGFAVSLAWVN